MTLGELLEGKELPVRFYHKNKRDFNEVIYFEVRYILKENAYGHYLMKQNYFTSTDWSLNSKEFELYIEPPKKKTVTLKKYQIVYKAFSGGLNATERWFKNEEEAKKFFIDYAPTSYTFKHLEGHDIEVEVDDE